MDSYRHGDRARDRGRGRRRIGPAAGAASRATQAQPAEPAKDYDQRALEIYEFRKAAQSGPHRGQEIYYYKCWMCHNELAQGGAPKLTGLFKRPTLVTGDPVNDETVKNQIRNGSANMGGLQICLERGRPERPGELAARREVLLELRRAAAQPALQGRRPRRPRNRSMERSPAGPRALVKNARGEPIEGIMVQLISEQTAIRTTVFSHADGRYEFPKVAPGSYTLRIAKPKEFYPWSKEKVEIKGADALEDITLLRVTAGEFLPPFPEIAAQLTGSEWLQNLPGTGEEKKTLTVYCNFCHEYQQIFRNHYDEAGWAKIVFRMTHGAGSTLINIRNPGRLTPAEEANFAHWLATARGPDSKDPNFVVQPRAAGTADQGGHHRIRVAAARHLGPRHRRRCPGPGLVLDPPQLLCGPAQSRQRACRGIPRAAAGGGRAARHALDLRRPQRARSGARRTGRTTSGRSIPT